MWEAELAQLKARISLNLKTLRKEKSIAQERLGLEAGVDRTVVSKIERQVTNPTLEVLVKLATYLGVTVTDLLNETAPSIDAPPNNKRKNSKIKEGC